jgi:TonB-linked SusC/RagA family outer membrane protein
MDFKILNFCLWRKFPKILLIMKLTAILILTISLQGLAKSLHSQNVSLDVKNGSLKKVFKEIQKQTGYYFLYSVESLERANKISIKVQNVSIPEALNICLHNTSLSYSIVEKTIVIKTIPDQPSLQVTLPLVVAVFKIKGLVTDESGKPLTGVSITIQQSSDGTTTNDDGIFELAVEKGQSLIISYVGYEKKVILVSNEQSVTIILVAIKSDLTDVVVIGYGTQNRSTTTGAVSTVKTKDLNQTNSVSIDNLLQGRAAGLNINSYTAQPGGALAINIRGAISPRGDNSPLFVIDGFPITTNASTAYNSSTGNFRGDFQRSPLDNINPNDIESIDILKDASATAIYGSAAANGVILITTKKGKEGKAAISYSGTYSMQTHKDFLQPLNATEFRSGVNEYGLEVFKFNNKLAPYGNGTTPIGNYAPYFTADQVANAGTGSNNIDFVLRNGMINDYNISMSTGTANTKIFTSFNYFDQKALLKNSNLKRYSGRINLDQKISNWVKFNLGLTFSQVNSDNVATGQSQDIDSPSLLQSALQFASDIPLLNADGKLNSSYYARTPNPASFLQITNQTFTNRFLATPSLVINLLDGMKLNITGGIDNTRTDRQFFIPVAAAFPTVPQGNAQRGFTKLNNYSAETFITYDKQLWKGKFSGVAGVGYYQSTFNDFSLSAVGFNTDVFGVDNIGIAYNRDLSSVSSSRSMRTKLSQFTRVNYTLLDKYILQFTGRFDGSSNFPERNLFGFFPGVSAGWVMNREKFLNNISWLNQLKLRAGYGTSGNESITTNGNYAYSLYSLSTAYSYLIGNQLYNSGFFQTQIGNPDLKWETDVTINAGIDFGLFNNRISGSLDYFNRTAKDLLDFRILPASNPITTQAFNVGSTRSKGFELTLKTENVVSKNFNWSSIITLGTAKTYWVARNPAVSLPDYIGANDPIRAQYGWKTNGLIRDAKDIPAYQTGAFVGNIKYVDLNGDNKLDIKDVTYLGNNDPKGTFGFNNTVRYKGLDLSVFIYGAYGNITYDGFQTYVQLGRLTRPGVPTNVDIHSLNAFTSFNTSGTYPGFAVDPAAANNPTGRNDFRTVKNSVFARLRNVNLGYSLPKKLVGKQKLIRSARFFIDLNNLYNVTNIQGFDPEMERNNNPYPTALTTAFGVNIQF